MFTARKIRINKYKTFAKDFSFELSSKPCGSFVFRSIGGTASAKQLSYNF